MDPILSVLIVLVIGGSLFAILAFFEGRRLGGPGKPIVVVDRRTYRLAEKRIQEALDRGDLRRAHFGVVALRGWLRGEIHTGPKRRRAAYAHALEQWELRAAEAGLRVRVDR